MARSKKERELRAFAKSLGLEDGKHYWFGYRSKPKDGLFVGQWSEKYSVAEIFVIGSDYGGYTLDADVFVIPILEPDPKQIVVAQAVS